MSKRKTLKLGEDKIPLMIDEVRSSKLIVLAHGAGAGMEHDFMKQLTAELNNQKISVIRFNFPYMAKGKKAPDHKNKLIASWESVMQFVSKNYPRKSVHVAGKSMGGRMASLWLTETELTNKIDSYICYGFPLHGAGKTGSERAAHLKEVNVPMHFFQGTRDTLAEISEMKKLNKKLGQLKITVVDGGDHSFKMLKSTGIDHSEVIKELAEGTKDWLK